MPDHALDAPVAIPLTEIDEAALPRDRTGLDTEPLDELVYSISEGGLRQPIEVWSLSEPRPPYRYGLISGYRRLMAFRRLHQYAFDKSLWETIPAFVRKPETYPAALAAMVEENEIRVEISPWERGLICVIAAREGAFETIDAAIAGLYPNAERQKRHRLRQLALVADEHFDELAEPQRLSANQCYRIARALSAGFGEVIRVAVQQSDIKEPDHQWSLIEPILREAEEEARNPPAPRSPGRPRRLLSPRNGLMIRRERIRDGWCLHFTGPEATGMLIDAVFDRIEQMFAPA
jgi:ParB family chromosome partitioning protein